MSIETTSPYLPEHASGSPSTGATATGYNPDSEEKKVIAMVEKFYKKAKNHKSNYDQKWLDYYKMFRGKQWKETRPSYRHSEVLNLVFQTIESMVPILTDARPRLEFQSTVKGHEELTDILNKVAENDWEHGNWLAILTEILYDSHFYGTGMAYVGFDQEANMGLGNILFESHDVFNAFPDPNARDVNDRRARYYVDAEPVDLALLKKEYKDKAQFLVADVSDLSKGDKTDLTQQFFKSPVDSRLYIEGSNNGDAQNGDKCLKITCYFKDDEVLEEAIEDAEPHGGDSEPKEVLCKKKYPRGRKIVIASGVLLEDSEIEFEDGQFPFVKLTNYALPREFWGLGEVEPLEGPQKTLNKLISFTLDVMTLMGNPVWVVGSSANIDVDNLINKPGLIIETDDPNAVRREPGVGLQPFVLELVDRYRQYIDGISGQTDLSRGATNNGVTAASAISSLQQAQQTRLRLKSRNIDKFLQDFGRMYMSRVFQYYSVPRIVRVSGDSGAEKFFQFHVENAMNERGEPCKVAHVLKDGMIEAMKYEIMGDFDVRVSTGSSLPFAKEEKTGISMNLFKLGVIDDEELLKNLDYPNYEEVLRRVSEKKAQAQQAQAQSQQQAIETQAQTQMSMNQQELQARAEIEKIKIQGQHGIIPQ